MPKKDYKVNDPIKVVYRAASVVSAVSMDVYDPSNVLDTTVALTQIDTSHRWEGNFTPDALGEWHIQITDSDGAEQIKAYSVGSYDLNDVGTSLDAVEAKVDTLDAKIDSLQSPPQIG